MFGTKGVSRKSVNIEFGVDIQFENNFYEHESPLYTNKTLQTNKTNNFNDKNVDNKKFIKSFTKTLETKLTNIEEKNIDFKFSNNDMYNYDNNKIQSRVNTIENWKFTNQNDKLMIGNQNTKKVNYQLMPKE